MAASMRRRPTYCEPIALQEEPASPPAHSRQGPRRNTLDEVALQDLKLLQKRGSVRGTFSTDSQLSRRVWRVVNRLGRNRRDYSLFLFHKNSPFRKSVKKVAKSWVFKVVMGIVVLLHFLALCFYSPAVSRDDPDENIIIYYVTVAVVMLYVVEACLNVVTYGLIHSSKAYLRKSGHVLDLVVITSGIVYIASASRFPVVAEVFACVMALKLLKIIALFPRVRFILKALAKSVAPLFYLSILTFCVITFLALIGTQLFSGSLHGGCLSNYSRPGSGDKTVFVSSFPCDIDGNSSRIGTHTCPRGSYCTTWEEGPHRGIISFDNMGVAYLTVFTVISLEGWIGILYLYESALGYVWVWSYFILVMFFGSIFILNLWTGVLTSVFIGVSDREEEHGQSRQLKEKQRINEDLQNYNEWLRIAAEMEAPSETGSLTDGRQSVYLWTDPFDSYSPEPGLTEADDSSDSDDTPPGEQRRLRSLVKVVRKSVRRVVNNRVFLWAVLSLRAVNLLLLMSLHFPSSPEFNTAIYSLNYIFSLVYVLEFTLRILSLSKRNYTHYFKNVLHALEVLLSLLTLLEFLVFLPVPQLRELHISVILNTVWCIKIIMFVKHTRSWGDMKKILRAVYQLFPSVLSLMALVVIFLFVFTILGRRLFGDRLSNTGLVEPNFDSFHFSFLLVFQLMTSEDWNNLLFTSLDQWIDLYGVAGGGLFSVYFVTGVSFGSFVLLSIFLAMSVDKLSEVRSLESDSASQHERSEKKRSEKKQQLSELKSEPQVKRSTLQKAMRLIFSDNEAGARQERAQRRQVRLLSPVERVRRTVRDARSPESPDSAPPVIRKQQNPLRLMKQRSEFYEDQKLRDLDSLTPSPHKQLVGELSLDHGVTPVRQDTLGYSRTQSSPADSPLSTMPEPTPLSEPPRLETIAEGPVLRRQNSITSEDHMTSVLPRGGSLEEVPSVSEETTHPKKSKLSGEKVKKRVLAVWAWMKDYVGTIQLNPDLELAQIPNHSSFFILSPDNKFREFCYRVVVSKSFSSITLVAVLVYSLSLALEVPLGVETGREELCQLQRISLYLDSFFIAFFIIEMILKMLALGVVLHKGSYLRGLFNILDLLILLANLVPLLIFATGQYHVPSPDRCLAYSYSISLPSISILRVFRVLRPLKAIRIGGLYLVVSGMVSSIMSMGSIFLLTLLVLIAFSVVGVQFFRGTFWYCTDPTKTNMEECRGQFFEYDYGFTTASDFPGLACPQVVEREWLRRGLNFDHIGFAMLSLYSMLTIEGWQNVMYHGINSFSVVDSQTARGQVPGSHNFIYSAIYFILFMVVMALILTQLFIGFVIVTFQEDGVKSFRESKLSRNQRNCLYFALTARPLRQYRPHWRRHREFHDRMLPVVNHPITQLVLFITITLNCLLLACNIYGQVELNEIIYYSNIVFTVFFTMEAVVKIVVYTPPTYFRSVSNLFDFLILLAALVELVVQLSFNLDPQYARSHIASSFRVLRLLAFIPNIRLILWTVYKSLEIFPWVGLLLMIVFYMYTVVGMQVFGNIRQAPIDEVEDTEITVYNNFANFPQALLVMIRMATGENWQDIMLSCVPGVACELGDTDNCGSDFAYFFFPSFYFLSSIMILNLLVAIVLDNFEYLVRDKSYLGAHHLDLFVKLWSAYDPDASGSLPPRTVVELMRQCNPPVGWGQLCPEDQAYKKMIKMNMKIVDGRVSFNATLFSLVRTSLKDLHKVQCTGCPNCPRLCNMDLKNKLIKLFPTLPERIIQEVLPSDDDHTVGEEFAALLVQRIWRGYIRKRKAVMALFHGNRRVLRAGLRIVPDAGPELLRRDTSHFELELPPLPTRVSESTIGSAGSPEPLIATPTFRMRGDQDNLSELSFRSAYSYAPPSASLETTV